MNRLIQSAVLLVAVASTSAWAQSKSDIQRMQPYLGVLAPDCSNYMLPQLKNLGDSLVVQDGGKAVLTGRNVKPAPKYFGATPPPEFETAFTSEVAGGEALVFVYYRNASGLFAAVEGGQQYVIFACCFVALRVLLSALDRGEQTRSITVVHEHQRFTARDLARKCGFEFRWRCSAEVLGRGLHLGPGQHRLAAVLHDQRIAKVLELRQHVVRTVGCQHAEVGLHRLSYRSCPVPRPTCWQRRLSALRFELSGS